MARNVKKIKLIISYPQSQAVQLPISNSLLATDNTHILLLNDLGVSKIKQYKNKKIKYVCVKLIIFW